MPCRVVLGGQWGDEGKGKVVDYLSARADAVVRCQGGANAGHTLVASGRRLAVHLIPSGVLHPHCEVILGNGMVIDPLALVEELETLETVGVEVAGRLRISTAAHMVLPFHREQDRLEEKARGRAGIGTTGRGIGPAYADKAARVGLQLGVLSRPEPVVRARVRAACTAKHALLRALDAGFVLDADAIVESILATRARLVPFLSDTTRRVRELLDAGREVLLEGAQGALLDLDHGSYPFVTSSSCTTAGALTGCGVSPRELDHVTGIIKAYSTRVGNGPFPTELDDADGEHLRHAGDEFGATTGRPRRCGWFDAVAVRHAARLNGFTEVVVTKLDVLDAFERIRIATAYEYDGSQTQHFPSDAEALAACTPRYVDFAGWQSPTRDCRSKADLPSAARRYLELLEDLIGVPIRTLSVGPDRDSTIALGERAAS